MVEVLESCGISLTLEGLERLETKSSYAGGQSCLHDQLLIKSLNTKVVLLVGNTLCIIIHQCWRKNTLSKDSLLREETGSSVPGLFWILLYVPLLLILICILSL